MGGGGHAPAVPAHDLAILIGAVIIIATVMISFWTQPESVVLESESMDRDTDVDGLPDSVDSDDDNDGLPDVVHLRTVRLGLLGHDKVRIKATYSGVCAENSSLCGALIVEVLQSGQASPAVAAQLILDGGSAAGAEAELTLDPDASGEFNIILKGAGEFEIEVQIERQIPLQWLPAVLGGLLFVWGIWRRSQE